MNFRLPTLVVLFLAADKRLPVACFLEHVGSEWGVYSAYTQDVPRLDGLPYVFTLGSNQRPNDFRHWVTL